MRKMLGQAFLMVFLTPVGSIGTTDANQRLAPREVRTDQLITQLNGLFIRDDLNKKPAEETLSLAKSIISLNEFQMDYFEFRTATPQAPLEIAEAQDNSTFIELRAAICKARPQIKLVTLEGKLEPCEQGVL